MWGRSSFFFVMLFWAGMFWVVIFCVFGCLFPGWRWRMKLHRLHAFGLCLFYKLRSWWMLDISLLETPNNGVCVCVQPFCWWCSQMLMVKLCFREMKNPVTKVPWSWNFHDRKWKIQTWKTRPLIWTHKGPLKTHVSLELVWPGSARFQFIYHFLNHP